MKDRTPLRLPGGLRVLYEDDELIVVDKPSGLLTVAAGAEKERTAYWMLCEALRRRGEKRRVAVVHRLDRDTSGVLAFAKSDAMKRELMGSWDESVERRSYVALAEGELPAEQGLIDAPLAEDRGGRVVAVKPGTPGALAARTYWSVLATGNGYSLLKLELETGRRNQIRAHLDWMGCPVAGDEKYRARTDPVRRLALHAERLVLRHPRTGESLDFLVPEPESFGKALKGRPAGKASWFEDKAGESGGAGTERRDEGAQPKARPETGRKPGRDERAGERGSFKGGRQSLKPKRGTSEGPSGPVPRKGGPGGIGATRPRKGSRG